MNIAANQQLGFIDFSAIGNSLVTLLPSAIDAYGKKKVAKVYAKAAAITAGPAAQPTAAPAAAAPAQPAPAVSFDFQSLIKPGLIVAGLITAAVVIPRLIPQGRH